MTDLTAHEQALVERVARAFFEAENGIDGDSVGAMLYENFRIDGSDHACMETTKAVCRLAAISALTALGLLGPSRTAWIAPWEASEGMEEGGDRVCNGACHLGSMMDAIFAAMRDAHLKETG